MIFLLLNFKTFTFSNIRTTWILLSRTHVITSIRSISNLFEVLHQSIKHLCIYISIIVINTREYLLVPLIQIHPIVRLDYLVLFRISIIWDVQITEVIAIHYELIFSAHRRFKVWPQAYSVVLADVASRFKVVKSTTVCWVARIPLIRFHIFDCPKTWWHFCKNWTLDRSVCYVKETRCKL